MLLGLPEHSWNFSREPLPHLSLTLALTLALILSSRTSPGIFPSPFPRLSLTLALTFPSPSRDFPGIGLSLEPSREFSRGPLPRRSCTNLPSSFFPRNPPRTCPSPLPHLSLTLRSPPPHPAPSNLPGNFSREPLPHLSLTLALTLALSNLREFFPHLSLAFPYLSLTFPSPLPHPSLSNLPRNFSREPLPHLSLSLALAHAVRNVLGIEVGYLPLIAQRSTAKEAFH